MNAKLAIATAAALVILKGTALACDEPHMQSFRWFFDKDKFGQLGVAGFGQIYILDQYKCYDLSFLKNKNLRIYFNNRSDDKDTEPTYVGALIMRVFSGKSSGEHPFSAYLYRNTTEEDSPSSWAQMKAGDHADIGSAYPASDVKTVDQYNAEKIRMPVDSIDALNTEKRNERSEVFKRLKAWHALVVAKSDQGYLVYDDTAAAAEQWFAIDIKPPASPQYVILRTYLTKYWPSKFPHIKEFFSSGAQSADCVYIKLVASGDEVESFLSENQEMPATLLR